MPRKKSGPKNASSKQLPEPIRSESMNSWSSTSPDLSPERLEALRRWVEAGGHNDPAVAETVARRIIERGDVRDARRDDRIDPRGKPGTWIH